jgi:hypothetical protein
MENWFLNRLVEKVFVPFKIHLFTDPHHYFSSTKVNILQVAFFVLLEFTNLNFPNIKLYVITSAFLIETAAFQL